MYYVATYVDVQPQSTTDALKLLKQYLEGTNAEAGSVWTTALQEMFRPNRFVTLEAWKDESAFHNHEGTGHTAEFRSGLKPIHNSPYDQRIHLGFAVGEVHSQSDPDTLYVVTH